MSFNTPFVLAQAIPPNTSLLAWTLGALNSFFSILMLLSAVLIFAGACYLVVTKRRPAVLAAYLVLLPLPVIISLCGWMKGMIASLVVIAATPNLEITNADIAGGTAASLLSVFVALIVSSPTYFVLAFGLLLRTLSPPTNTGATSTNSSAPRKPMLSTTGLLPTTS